MIVKKVEKLPYGMGLIVKRLEEDIPEPERERITEVLQESYKLPFKPRMDELNCEININNSGELWVDRCILVDDRGLEMEVQDEDIESYIKGLKDKIEKELMTERMEAI